MDAELLYTTGLLAAGTLGGIASFLLPASGKAALGLGVVPPAGIGLSMAFC